MNTGTPISQTPVYMLDKKTACLIQLNMMKTERSTWDPHWKKLGDFVRPRRTRFMTTDRNKGDRRNQNIIDNTATLASRTLGSSLAISRSAQVITSR